MSYNQCKTLDPMAYRPEASNFREGTTSEVDACFCSCCPDLEGSEWGEYEKYFPRSRPIGAPYTRAT